MDNKKLDVAIIDYQMSNMFSVLSACKLLGLNAEITNDKNMILDARGAILPGVGSFKEAMTHLEKLGLVSTIHDFVSTEKPFMGICLGMQLLFTHSEEFGMTQGLDIIPGVVTKFHGDTHGPDKLKVPQIGWNRIKINQARWNSWQHQPFEGVPDESYMYFVHSFFVTPHHSNAILTTTMYGETEYCSSVIHNNVFASQFHPEKSATEGIKMYRNFAQSL